MPDYHARLPRWVFPPHHSCLQCRKILSSRFGLTPCEQFVGLFLIAGYEDREIATHLERKLFTAKTHVKHILMRTNQVSRTGAASAMLAALWRFGPSAWQASPLPHSHPSVLTRSR